jgi:hypothetical protein
MAQILGWLTLSELAEHARLRIPLTEQLPGADEQRTSARLDTPYKIDLYRRCIAVGLERGRLTREEYAVAVGNLDEAAALLRLKAAV